MNKSYLILGLLAIVLVAGFTFQWPAVTQGWPVLFFLLCPLMHLFMGHNHGGSHGSSEKSAEDHKKHEGHNH
jgi:hypothetical protein